MCLVGVPYYVCAFSMFDLQVRYYVRSMNGTFQLPSSEQMMLHWQREMAERAARGYTRRQAHMMGPDQPSQLEGSTWRWQGRSVSWCPGGQGAYYAALARESAAAPLPPVLARLHGHSSRRFLHHLAQFRADRYRILDADSFVCHQISD
ncbi:unnamed protein product, partial [Iphiclides podalirius]